MALRKYFKPINQSILPLPSGPLSEIVPSSSIEAANKEVESIVSQVEKSSSENDPEGNSTVLRLQQTTHFGIHGSRKPWRQTRTYHDRPFLVKQFLIVGFGIMLSSKIYSRKVSQRLIIEKFVPRNYLAIRYT